MREWPIALSAGDRRCDQRDADRCGGEPSHKAAAVAMRRANIVSRVGADSSSRVRPDPRPICCASNCDFFRDD